METTKVILVTGSNSGFGRLTVETLGRQGHLVFAGMRASTGRNAAAAGELRALAKAGGSSLHVVDIDVTDDASVDAAVQSIVEAAGRLDVVVNNAGFAAIGPIEAFTTEQARRQFDTNVLGALRVNHAALPHMRAQGSGLLLQVGSLLGRLALPFTGIYAASKYALEGLTEAYRTELAGLGIDAAIVEAGSYPTGIGTNGMQPADAARIAPYGAAFAQFGTKVSEASRTLPNAQEVADAIAHLIALPAGTRPLRTVLAGITFAGQQEGVIALNQASEHAIAATASTLGLAPSLAAPALR